MLKTDTLSIYDDQSKKVEWENRFRSIVEYAADAIILVNHQGMITYWNTGAQAMFGYEPHEIIGKPATTLLPRQMSQSEQKNFSNLVASGRGPFLGKTIESVAVHKDQSEIPIEISLCSGSHGGEIFFYGIIRNITERKQAENSLIEAHNDLKARERELQAANKQLLDSERRLKESNEYLETIFTTTADGMMVTNGMGQVVKVNQALERILGFSARELIGKYTHEMGPDDEAHRKVRDCMFEELFEKGFAENWRSDWHRKDGSLVPVEINLAFLKDAEDNLTGAVGTIRDITERQKAEAELIKLNTAIEQAEEIVMIMDQNGTIQYVNQAAVGCTGYSRDEIIGQNIFKSKKGLYDQSFYQDIAGNIQSGNVGTVQLTHRKSDGSTVEMKTTISPIRDDGNRIINFVAISRDVTKEVSLEKQLYQAQKMEAIGTLAGGIAHDFNNILTAILGYSELSQDLAVDNEKLQNNISQILHASKRARDLVRQILTFSRAEDHEKRPVNLVPILKESVDFIRASFPSTIEIRCSINTDSDIILADPTQIHQLFMNICTNAGHAMKAEGGILEVNLTNTAIGHERAGENINLSPGRYVQLTVSDSGSGMKKEIMSKIFDPYFTTKEKTEGTGLGLAVVHGIVKQLGGDIRVTSSEGRGTTFYVFLPVISDSDLSSAVQSSVDIVGGCEHILLVDDETTIAEMAREMLTTLGYEVCAYDNPLDALKKYHSNPNAFDLIITDKTMPGMTGFDLSLKAVQARPDMPIIMITGFSEETDLNKASSSGVREIIMKPIIKRELAEKIRSVLDRPKPSRPRVS